MSKAAIYVRRSVSDEKKDNNSFSIQSQVAQCIAYLGEDEDYELYIDNGKSGKDDIHRPSFMRLMRDCKDGLIGKVIVKKLDRFSRNDECAPLVNELDKLGIPLISLSEQYDASTPQGRLMRRMSFSFAIMEREIIAERVRDAYATKAHETGFFQGGVPPFGYIPERRTVNDKTGSVLVASEDAYAIQVAYQLYQQPCNSTNDVINALKGATGRTAKLTRTRLTYLLDSPLYVRANADVYRYLAAQGVELLDDIEAYDGIHGVFLHGKYNNKTGKMFAKIGYHEGLVDADVWLTVQHRREHQKSCPSKLKGVNTWLVGLVKCAHCGYALTLNVQRGKWRYYRDSGWERVERCVRLTPSVRPDDVEQAAFNAMKERLAALEIAKKEQSKPNPEVKRISDEIVRIEQEINSLMDKVALANDTLIRHINARIEELDGKKADLENQLQRLKHRHKSIDTEALAEPLSRWQELTLEEKQAVATQMIEVIKVSNETGIEIKLAI